MPTIPLWPLALVYMAGMFTPLGLSLNAKRADWAAASRQQRRWTCYLLPALLYICFWNATAAADWIGGAIMLPFLILGTYMASLMLRMGRVLDGDS